MTEFSVLLSVYIKENPRFLNDCFQSIFINQSIKPNEVILVKDGDLTNELDLTIEKWASMYPSTLKIISLQNNKGLGYSLNLGMKHCSYKWVFRMDTDDICVHDRFKKQLEYIKENPNIVLLGGGIEEFDGQMKMSLGRRVPPLDMDDIIHYTKKRNPFNHMSVVFNKDIINLVGGYMHHLYMEDYNLWIRIISSGYQVANLSDILVKVRGGDSMIKRRKGFSYIKSELQLTKLKIDKNIDTPLKSYFSLILRSAPRILPTFFLSKIYKKLRK